MSKKRYEEFLYPRSLLPNIKKAWESRGTIAGGQQRLPPDHHIVQLLDTAFQASLSSHEGHATRVHIAYCDFSNLATASAEAISMLKRNSPISFKERRRLTVGEIVQLAPAADPRHLMVGVGPAQGTHNNQIEIWGLVDIGYSSWEFARGESDFGWALPDCLVVSIMSPGALTVSRGDEPLVSLEKGRLVRPMSAVFRSGPVAQGLSQTYHQFHNDVCRDLGTDTYDPEGSDERYPDRFLQSFIERILFRIRDGRHGGSLLVVPDEWDIADTRLLDRVNIKYPTVESDIWTLLVQHLSLHRRYYNKLLPTFKKKTMSKSLFDEIESLSVDYEEAEQRVRDKVSLLASLANVDGSVLLTTRLRLLGFGVEVVAQSPNLGQIKVARSASGTLGHVRTITDYGTRHRSAFRFCSSHESLLAFVVSQDGDVRAVKRVGSDVVLWSGILS